MPATPFLRVDGARLWRNVHRTAERATAAGVALRPHVETHKSPDLARIQLAAGAVGITVATIGEAEVFADQGCDDIVIAYPLWLDDAAAVRVRDVARGCRRSAAPLRTQEGNHDVRPSSPGRQRRRCR